MDTHDPSQFSASALDAARLPPEAERLATEIVASQLRGLFADAENACNPADAIATLRPSHARWLEATLRHLERHGLLSGDAQTQRSRFAAVEPVETLWQRWDEAMRVWAGNVNHRAYLALIEACLRKLPEIFTGAVPATDVMFPESSMHLVEGIYKHNLIADHFNLVLGESLRDELAAKTARGERGLRLLEIGAGTGGTTTALLPTLRGFSDRIDEYCYTDLSKAFLLHAEEVYKPQFPAIRTAIFDVGKPLALQSVEGNRYDAVIATNVLHATSNMRETVRNAKALLKRGGVLLVNELSEWAWYTHFTFGLLEGWWLYEDESLRLPGCPCLSPKQWENLLKVERFHDIRFPASAHHGLGQLVLAARSDGVVRQRLVPPAAAAKAPAPNRASAAASPAVHAAAAQAAPVAPAPAVAASAATGDAWLADACASLFRDMIAAALRMDVREIETSRPLEQYGLDSILVVQLTTHFRKLFPGVRSTLFFEVQSIDGLVRHFLDNDRATVESVLAARGIVPATAAATPPVAAPAPAVASAATAPLTAPAPRAQRERRRFAPRHEAAPAAPATASPAASPASSDTTAGRPARFDVAIIGISGRYPQSPDLERFWENLSAGRDCAGEVPADRWHWQDHYDPEKGPGFTRWGGFIDDVDKFDPLFFRIAPKEAKKIDPQERLFLETSYHAIEDSGYTPDTLAPNGKVGVFVGVMNSRYTPQPLFYSIANRISFLFDFSGPSFAVDSACSASLTAIHVALDSLYSGMCEAAIAGGVSLILDPQHMLELTALGMLSEGGKCRSFGTHADGFLDAEGVGAVILKPLAHALRDGDHIHAVIKGSALNAGGRTHGYTVPNPVAQAAVVSAALTRADIDSADVSYLEAHGTGTALGDPIEVAGLTRAFRANRRATDRATGQHCAIGSLKSNIGHCESAAGIAALTKVLLQLRHRQLVPTLHAEQVNEEIDFSTTPFRLQRELAAWRAPLDGATGRELPRIAGISSFGAGGANAHLVVQEAPVSARPRAAVAGPRLVPLSARNAEQLQDKIRQLLAYLQREGANVDLEALAYTLQVGREAMDERIALIVDSADDLRRQLQALADGQRPDPEPQRGNVRKNREFLAACRADPDFASRCEAWTAQRDLARIAEHWAKGVGIDWAQLYAGADARPGRIPLPTYPFARDRHWIEPQRSLGHGQAAAARHPLLQRNTSTLRYPAYAVELKGDERFLGTDAAGQRHLPALLCLEMARAAVAEAYPDDIAARELRFEGVALDDGLRIDAGCELQIALLPDSDDALRFEIHSALGDAERVHAQGRALFVAPVAPAQADVAAFAARLSRGISTDAFHGHFATLGLADATEHRVVRRVARSARELVLEYAGTETTASGPWGLPPDVLASVLQGAAWLLGELGPLPSTPFAWRIPAIDVVRFHGQCAQQGYLVLRCEEQAAADAETTRWDATCFDANGHPTLDIAGLRLSRLPVGQGTAPVASATAVVTAAAVTAAVAATPVAASRPTETAATETRLPAPVLPEAGRKLAFLRATASAVRAPVVTDRPHAKPQTLTLPAAADLPGPGPVPTARPTIALHRPDADLVAVVDADAAVSCVDLRDLGDGVYSLTVEADAPTAAAIDQLLQALTHLRDRADAKALLIAGGENAFRRGDAAALDAAIAAGLYRALLDFPLPTIAAPQGDADGGGFLLAALCDFMVCAEESRYGFSDPGHGFHPTTAEADLLAARFGASRANDLLYVSGAQSGQALAAKGWTMPVVQRAKTLSTALALAASIAAKPRESLALLKTHMADALAPLVARLGSAPRPQSGPVAPPKAAGKPPKARAGIAIEPLSDSVVSVRLRAGHATRSAALRDLRATLTDLAQRGGHAAIVLRSDLPDFLPASGDGDARASAAELVSLQATLSDLPVPVVVAFEHDTDGFGWLLGLSADACVHGERGRCSAEALWRDSALLRQAMPVFARRLGDNLARMCLFGATAIDAAALAAGAAIVATDVLATTLALLDATPLRSADALRQWRQRNRAVDTAQESVPTGERRAAPLPSSPAIETEVRDNGVIVVRMVDRDAKNMYSPALIRGLEEVFAHIDGCDDYRAVVLTGYDTYFACGGTREGLLAIQQGAAKFTDAKVYQLPMSCRLPVIAAMQGHAIGGGWTLGMFADLCLFSAESRYISPYMQYGFTPGAGSTLIFPARLGADLAKETLFTAHEYTGSELRAKGLPHVCVPRSEVLPRALALADAIAARAVDDVLAMKRHFSAADLAQVEATYARELAMHDRSFVGQSHALQGVMQHFLDDGDGGGDVAPVQAQPAPIAAATPAATDVPEPVDADGIADFLKSLLAFELQLRADDVDEDTQFVDLGLDSITGVTWVRKINAEYGTKIEATKVYSHPTLRQFRDFVVALIAARQGASKPAPSASRTVAPQIVAPAVAVAQQVAATVDAFAPQVAATVDAFAPQVVANGTHDSEADLCAALKRLLAQELHMSEEDVDEHRQFVELGLDSITGVTWVRKINAEYGTKIEATKVYSHPTLVEFSRFLRGLLPKQAVAPAPAVARVAPAFAPTHPVATTAIASRPQPATQSLTSWRKQGARRASSAARGDDAIAVIGIAGQFPRAKTLDAFWRNIAGAKECIDLVPPQRFDIERFFNEDISVPGTTNSRWMGVLEDCDVFDPLFFNISPIEAECMDPQQRLMLQTCWHAIENAAIDPRSLSGSRCGVFVGCGATDYHQRSREHELSSQGFTGAAMSILAARIAYFLNLQGPCLSIDTACSSSLVAIANACDSLVAQNCDLALAGGVAVMAGPAMHVKNAQSGMLSPDGRCFAFDHRANGFVPGEGVGTVLLKRLADAERDGDIVHAVIRGWGVNQDGKTNGITAPNPVSQTRLMRAIYDRFGIDPEDIQLVEAHGTGTELGDPIEVEGLTEAFRHYTDKTQYCALGSVKGNIGHSLYAAGVAGVLKLVLALKHRQLPPAASFERLNPHIDLSDSPFHVNTALQPWPENARGGRAAVVSSFGFSGTNAHLVLEAAPPRAVATAADAGPSRPALIPLSAKTPEQLRQRARDLAEFLEASAAHADAAPSLQDIAYTLQVGKEAMEERCALVARSLTELDDRLRAFAAGETPKGMHVGSSLSRAGKLAFIGQDRDLQAVLIQTCLREGKLDKLAELWVDGVDLPWDTLHRDATGARPRRIELPLYPFAREHYWLEDERSAPGFKGAGAAAVLHPLLHANVSTLRQQRYRTTFDGSEFFLRDHRVRFGEGRIEHVLPGVAYLEMAAAAVADALPDDFADAGSHERLVLSNVAWWRPVVVDGPTTVEIELGIDDAGAIVFEIASGTGEGRVVHCQGEAGFVDAVGERMIDAALLAAAPRGEQWEGDDIYAAFGPMGLHYGPAHRGLRTLSRTGGKLVAAVELPAVAGCPEAYRMHPSVMDSALQACIGFLPSLQALPHAPAVPFALRSLTLHAPCPAEAIVVLSPTGAAGAGPVENCDVSIFDADGALCVDIRGFVWRGVDKAKAAAVAGTGETRGSDAAHAPASRDDAGTFDEAFYRELLDSISRKEMSAEKAAELGLLS